MCAAPPRCAGLRDHNPYAFSLWLAAGGLKKGFIYLAPLIFPVTATLKPFLAKNRHSAEDVDKMHAAWVNPAPAGHALESRLREGRRLLTSTRAPT